MPLPSRFIVLHFMVLTSILLLFCPDAQAQPRPRDLPSVRVLLDDTASPINARLVSVDANTVTLLVKNQKTSVPLDRVVRITAKHRDSVRNGALIGAVIGGVLCALNCGQGLDRGSQLPLAVASTAGIWGAAGAAIDATSRREEILYERERPAIFNRLPSGSASSVPGKEPILQQRHDGSRTDREGDAAGSRP